MPGTFFASVSYSVLLLWQPGLWVCSAPQLVTTSPSLRLHFRLRRHHHEAFPDHPTQRGLALALQLWPWSAWHTHSVLLEPELSVIPTLSPPGLPGCTRTRPPTDICSLNKWPHRPRDGSAPDTHINLAEDDIDDAANDDQEVKHIPGVTKIALGGQGWELG